MSDDLRELLRSTASPPSRPVDVESILRAAHRQTVAVRATTSLGVIVVVALAALGLASVWRTPGQPVPHIAAQPPAESRSGAPSAVGDLRFTSWTSQTVLEDGRPHDLFTDVAVHVEFPTIDHQDAVAWTGGCNRVTSQVDTSGGRLVLDGERWSTAMACDGGDRQARQEWVDEFFTANPAWVRTGNRLTLTAGSSEVRLEATTGAGSVALTIPEGWKVEALGTDEPPPCVDASLFSDSSTIYVTHGPAEHTVCHDGPRRPRHAGVYVFQLDGPGQPGFIGPEGLWGQLQDQRLNGYDVMTAGTDTFGYIAIPELDAGIIYAHRDLHAVDEMINSARAGFEPRPLTSP